MYSYLSQQPKLHTHKYRIPTLKTMMTSPLPHLETSGKRFLHVHRQVPALTLPMMTDYFYKYCEDEACEDILARL